jgi:hypothetical protein
MAQPLFETLDIRYPTTSTITKHLTAFVDDTTMDWEIYVPALMFAYNTSFHRSVQATAFSQMYGLKVQLPSFFALDFCRMHDPKMENDNLLCMLHHPWQYRIICWPQTDKMKILTRKLQTICFMKDNMCH